MFVSVQKQVHRLLAQNREMLIMIQKLMTQVSDQHAKNHSEPLNQKWMLSELSPSATVLESSTLFPDNPNNGLGTKTIDFNSQIFDNINIGTSESHLNVTNSTSSTANNKLTFDDIIVRNHPTTTGARSSMATNTSNTMATNNDMNPFSAAPPIAGALYKSNENNNTRTMNATANNSSRNKSVTGF